MVRPVLSPVTSLTMVATICPVSSVQPNPGQVVRGGPGPGCIYILLVCGHGPAPSSSTAAPH